MPYVTEERRKHLGPYLREVGTRVDSPGDLTYAIYHLALEYLERHGKTFQTCNDVVGAQTNAVHEFRRRVVDPYEDIKIEENGDVVVSDG